MYTLKKIHLEYLTGKDDNEMNGFLKFLLDGVCTLTEKWFVSFELPGYPYMWMEYFMS